MTDRWFRVVRVTGQGYATMTPELWDATPEMHRERVQVLQLCDSQEGATAAYHKLPQEWRGKKNLHEAHGQWWEDSGLVLDGMRLHVPADTPLPVIEVEIPPELHVLADILGRLPAQRNRAETRALDWYATHPSRR